MKDVSEDRVKELESFEGWTWDPEDIFKKDLEIKKYLENNPSTRVPRGYIDVDGFKLEILFNQKEAVIGKVFCQLTV